MTPRDEANRARARSARVNVLVEAGAGTGKTTLLVDRVIHGVIEREIPLSRILLITFMDKAREEMRRRVEERLSALGSDVGLTERRQALARAALAALPDAAITTIHGFCQGLLAEFGFDYGIPVGFQVLEPVDVERLWRSTFDQWMAEVAVDDRGRHILELLRAGISWEHLVKWARQICDWPVVPHVSARHPRVEGFVSEYGAQARDLARFALEQAAPDEAGVRQIQDIASRFALVAATDQASWPRLLAQWTDGFGPKGNKKNWADTDALTAQKEWIGSLKEVLAVLRANMSDAYLADWLRLIAQDFRPRWRHVRFSELSLTFDDLVVEAQRVLSNPAVVRTLSSRFDLVMVDEFQDTDSIQSAIIRRLVTLPGLERLSSKDQGRLFLVGDPKQSIYRFRGADVEAYAAVRAELAHTGGELIPITENFRSNPAILDFVNAFFHKRWPQEPDPDRPFLPPFSPLSSPYSRDDRDRVRVVQLEAGQPAAVRRRGEAQDIAARIGQALSEGWPVRASDGGQRPMTYGDIAIIVPQRTDWEIYRDALMRAHIPVATQSGRKFFGQDEIRGVRHLFRILAAPDDAVAAAGWLLSPWVGLDYAVLIRHRRDGGSWDFRDATAGHPDVLDWWAALSQWHELFWRVEAETVLDWALQKSALTTVLRERGDEAALANLNQLRGLLREFGDRWGIFEFTTWLDRQVQEQAPFDEAAVGAVRDEVTFSTVHQAKGLEWPLVVVANWRPSKTALDTGIHYNSRLGLVALRQPPWQSSGWDALKHDHRLREEAEGDRLLYVALTRARDYLWFYASFLEMG